MPLYEYKCLKCEKIHEIMQKFSDAPLVECPECQGALTKLMSLSSFALKGAGWYSTDYKRSSSKSSSDTSSSNSESTATATAGAGTTSASASTA